MLRTSGQFRGWNSWCWPKQAPPLGRKWPLWVSSLPLWLCLTVWACDYVMKPWLHAWYCYFSHHINAHWRSTTSICVPNLFNRQIPDNDGLLEWRSEHAPILWSSSRINNQIRRRRGTVFCVTYCNCFMSDMCTVASYKYLQTVHNIAAHFCTHFWNGELRFKDHPESDSRSNGILALGRMRESTCHL